MPNDSPKPLLNALLEGITLHDDPGWHKYPKARKALKATHQITRALDHGWDRIAEAESNEVLRKELADALVALHIKYVVPLDIPGVGPVIEGIVDHQIGKLIPRLVDEVADRLKALPSLTSSAA